MHFRVERGSPTVILLIDNSASVREVLRLALESEGYSVIETADGFDGVCVFREHRAVLVLVDVVMPEQDGIETVREILAIGPTAVNFTMSGRDEDFQDVARRLGARRGFMKPVRMVETHNALGRFRDGGHASI